eukprot:7380826-Prymnesium_polylepis.2
MTLRTFGLREESLAIRAAASNIGCAPGKPACSNGTFAVIDATAEDLDEVERALLHVAPK